MYILYYESGLSSVFLVTSKIIPLTLAFMLLDFNNKYNNPNACTQCTVLNIPFRYIDCVHMCSCVID